MADGTAAPDPELLRRLEERVDRATETAERLLRAAVAGPPRAADAQPQRLVVEDAGAPGATDRRPPPAGWQRPGQQAREARWVTGDELELLMAIVAGVRDRIPAELQQRLAEAVRELLVALRALIDWYLELLERGSRGPDEVQDIPIL